jgi:predicted nucleotidyltransferase
VKGVTADLAIEPLLAALRAGPPLRLAMLFGSAVSGPFRPDCDVDVAIIPAAPDLALADELDLQASLARACGREVDLVRLDRASTLVRWQVARHGKILLQSSMFEATRFVAEAASEYLDFEPAFTRAAERFRQRLAAGKV